LAQQLAVIERDELVKGSNEKRLCHFNFDNLKRGLGAGCDKMALFHLT
jgi:hypothetical protein